MERLYKALVWLAGLALVAGLARALLLWTQANITLTSGLGIDRSQGIFSMFLAIANSGRMLEALAATNLLIGGVMVMALVIAWADRRRGWLIALIIVVIIVLAWPAGVQIWDVSGAPMSPQPYPTPISLVAQIVNESVYAMPLIPLVMALILGLTKRDGAAHGAHDLAIQSM